MRRILLDNARKHVSAKRGKGEKIALEDAAEISVEPNENLITLDLALQELEEIDERQSKIIELRYFGGLTIEETAEVLKISAATVKREWTFARAWLFQRMRDEG